MRRFFCDSHRIQTCNLLIRSQMLYSVELANQPFIIGFATAKLQHFLESTKFSGNFFHNFLNTAVFPRCQRSFRHISHCQIIQTYNATIYNKEE